MNKQVNILLLACPIAALVSLMFLASNPTAENSVPNFYKDCINKQIRMYLLKEQLYKNSRFEQLQKGATLAMKKATFLRVNQDRLVEEMTRQQVAKKSFHIHTYLDKKFLESHQQKHHVAYRPAISSE